MTAFVLQGHIYGEVLLMHKQKTEFKDRYQFIKMYLTL